MMCIIWTIVMNQHHVNQHSDSLQTKNPIQENHHVHNPVQHLCQKDSPKCLIFSCMPSEGFMVKPFDQDDVRHLDHCHE